MSLLTTKGIAQLLGLANDKAVRNMIHSNPGFPKPIISGAAQRPNWYAEVEVLDWWEKRKKRKPEPPKNYTREDNGKLVTAFLAGHFAPASLQAVYEEKKETARLNKHSTVRLFVEGDGSWVTK